MQTHDHKRNMPAAKGEQTLLTMQAERAKFWELLHHQCHQMQHSKQSVTQNNRCEQEVHDMLSTFTCLFDGQFMTLFSKCTPLFSEYKYAFCTG